MKNAFFLLAFICLQTLAHAQTSWIRINQIGYLTDDVKVAVLVSKDAQLLVNDFEVCDAFTAQTVFTGTQIQAFGQWGAFEKAFRLTFSGLNTEGAYFIKVGAVR